MAFPLRTKNGNKSKRLLDRGSAARVFAAELEALRLAFEQEARDAEDVEPRKQPNFRLLVVAQRSTTQINEALLALTQSNQLRLTVPDAV